MLTKLESYTKFQKKVNHFIELIDNCVPELYEMERDIVKIIETTKRYKIPEIDYNEQSIYALLLSIMANTKANSTHYKALKARIEALNKFINLSHLS